MQRINLITTGGTIEKEYSEQLGKVHNSAAKIGQYLKLLRLPGADITIRPLMNKDSLEMTAQDREGLVREVERCFVEGGPVLITHGTDTMVETGMCLLRALPRLEAPVILTGAMTPLGFEGSDGLQNLTESLFAAQVLQPGVYVVFHGQVFPVDRVRKDRDAATFVALEADERG